MLSATLSGQKLFKNVRNSYGSFGARITKVVLQGNTLTDILLADAIKKNWIISPYEFCYVQEYERIKEDTSYNFLLRTDGIFNKEYEPKLEYLTLIKGGPEFRKGLFMTTEYISLPLQSIGDPSGHFHSFLPAFLNIMQDYVIKAAEAPFGKFSGIGSNSELKGLNGRNIIFGVNDFGYSTDSNEIKWSFRNRAQMVEDDVKEKALMDYLPDTAVSLVIFPLGEKGGYCYKMIIGSDNHRLYYLKKHRITSQRPSGFTKKEIKKISFQYST